MAKRLGLQVLRAQRGGLTRKAFAAELGVSYSLYCLIEQGKRTGGDAFWLKLQSACDLSDGQVWRIRNGKANF